jgi:hypothetical protein
MRPYQFSLRLYGRGRSPGWRSDRETKERKTFTLTPTAIQLLARASRLAGMSESTYVEQAVREKFARTNVE